MNELTKLLDAVRALESALVAFSERVSLQSTLDAFPADGKSPAQDDALDPHPTADELKDMLQKASGQLGVDVVRTVIAEEADGKKVADMTGSERNMVRIGLEFRGFKR